MMTYSESANGISIGWQRAVAELRRHGSDDADSVREFRSECWAYHNDNGQIRASLVLEWLGY